MITASAYRLPASPPLDALAIIFGEKRGEELVLDRQNVCSTTYRYGLELLTDAIRDKSTRAQWYRQPDELATLCLDTACLMFSAARRELTPAFIHPMANLLASRTAGDSLELTLNALSMQVKQRFPDARTGQQIPVTQTARVPSEYVDLRFDQLQSLAKYVETGNLRYAVKAGVQQEHLPRPSPSRGR